MVDKFLELFHEILVDGGLKEDNRYHKIVGQILEDNHLSIDELYIDLPYWIYFYECGEGKIQNDKSRHQQSCALKAFKRVFKNTKEFHIKFFEETTLSRDEYCEIKKLMDWISFENTEFRNRTLLSIKEIKLGCNEFFFSLCGEISVFGTAFVILDTLFSYKRILTGDYGRISNLNFIQHNILKQIVTFIIARLNKHKTNKIVVGLKKSETVTIEQLIHILDLLN